MLAKLGTLPSDDAAYGYEIKWDGIRAILYSERGRVRLINRNLRDVTLQYPELRDLGRALGARELVLDGEIVALAESGRPSFERLQQRMHLASDSGVRRKLKAVPITYMIFDLLYLDGHSTIGLPYRDRRSLLDRLELAGSYWRTPTHHTGDGPAMLAASREQGLEGVIAKRLDSSYEPGRRSGAWLKIKNVRRQELVIGGWMPGQGARSASIGALLVGYYDVTPKQATERRKPQRLLYAGRVGTGFSDEALTGLARALAPLRRRTSPFDGRQPPRGAVFVKPELVAEIEFSEWTRTRTLRHPSFKGLRNDKDAQEVVLETTAADADR
jgi:bifunctional non-homologous end joining protein LigD